MLTQLLVDVWSVGCILAELLGGRPFFKGRDYVDQLNQILRILGTPNEETLSRIGSPRAQEYVRNLPYMKKQDFSQIFSKVDPRTNQAVPPNPDAVDLLNHMLAFDPSSRITVEAALEHPYLAVWHDATDEPGCLEPFGFDFEAEEDVGELKKLILKDVAEFRVLREKEIEEEEALKEQEEAIKAQQQWQHQQQQQQQYRIEPQQGTAQWKSEDPRPQEAPQQQYGQATGLEQELQYGLDAHQGYGQRY